MQIRKYAGMNARAGEPHQTSTLLLDQLLQMRQHLLRLRPHHEVMPMQT